MKKLNKYKNINWKIASAENLPIQDNSFDYYTISFGIRNVENINIDIDTSTNTSQLKEKLSTLEGEAYYRKIKPEFKKKNIDIEGAG